jgi:hypothetical protein
MSTDRFYIVAKLRQAQGLPANDDFLDGIKYVTVRAAALAPAQEGAA